MTYKSLSLGKLRLFFKKRGRAYFDTPSYIKVVVTRDYLSSKISSTLQAEYATGVPGPKMAATPALYKKS